MALPAGLAEAFKTPGHATFASGKTALNKHYGNNLNERRVDEALANITSYSLTREIKPPRPRNPTFVYSMGRLQMDLIEVGRYLDNKDFSRANQGVKYLLVGIELFSRRLYVEPLRSKNANDTLTALKKLLVHAGHPGRRRVISIFCDRGKEFVNRQVQTFLSSENIMLLHPSSRMIKAAVVERVNRSLKSLLTRYCLENRTRVYLPVLPDLVSSYNNRFHRTLQMSPMQAEAPENRGKEGRK